MSDNIISTTSNVTLREKLAFIRQKCIAANLDIIKRRQRFVFTDTFIKQRRHHPLGSRSGEVVTANRRGSAMYILKDGDRGLQLQHVSNINIIGVPIRLADV